ncbi:MAG: nickel-dependent hydrogenase large subunit [Heliobacteriaceae bacterium]|nr:nickel-dependent hydrogenase large subunit [Heliobacteriaceae bacterium]MDD4588440.1 nickel-dependent hydrogenase large subunit [Heliobacteriaceae bacterium]
MAKQIILNPVTRISGFMAITVTIENRTVVAAQTSGLLFRGFEQMLIGRNPFDAVYFTQRICGICSAAHSLASTLALENALQIKPGDQGRYLRDIVHGCEFLQNHIRHFYQYTLPDYVKMPADFPVFHTQYNDFRLPKDRNDELVRHYFASLEISRQAHEMLAVLGGKAPHNHGVFIGGITTRATAAKIIKIKAILATISQFINEIMLPDVYTIAEYYPEYFDLGKGYGNLLSYGCFDGYSDLGTLYVNPSVYIDGKIQAFDPAGITEEIDYSWYRDRVQAYRPFETMPVDEQVKPQAYSWVKAARYHNLPFEVGPLARQWLSGDYRRGISALDRTIARVLEAKKITNIITTLVERLVPGTVTQDVYQVPRTAAGAGLIDTTRGALGHWLKIAGGKLSFYQIITPTVWNLSSHGNNGLPGTAEQALSGTPVADPDKPVELGRVIRSFDPCISCATHVYVPGKPVKTVTVVP